MGENISPIAWEQTKHNWKECSLKGEYHLTPRNRNLEPRWECYMEAGSQGLGELKITGTPGWPYWNLVPSFLFLLPDPLRESVLLFHNSLSPWCSLASQVQKQQNQLRMDWKCWTPKQKQILIFKLVSPGILL